MNKIQASITTAPLLRSNGATYLLSTVESLQNAGFLPEAFADRKRNPRQHWLNTAGATLERIDKGIIEPAEFVLMCQDDILVAKGIGDFLAGLKWRPKAGCLSLYNCDRYAGRAGKNQPSFKLEPQETFWGACALLFPIDVLRKVVKASAWKEFPGNRDIDRVIATAVHSLGLEFWVLNPSSVQHIGEISTLCEFKAKGWRQASSFIGEDGSCGIYASLWE